VKVLAGFGNILLICYVIVSAVTTNSESSYIDFVQEFSSFFFGHCLKLTAEFGLPAKEY